MVEKISNYFVDKVLFKDEKPTDDEREIALFGVTRIMEDIPKYIVIFIVSLVFNILKEVGIIFLIVLIYKTFIGGAHARTNIGCFIATCLFFITPPFIARYLQINELIFYIMLFAINLFSIYVILRYVPADTEEVPILNKKKRKIMRIFAFVSQILIDLVLLIFIKDNAVREIVLVSILYCNVMTTKVAYKFFRSVRSKDSEEFKECY